MAEKENHSTNIETVHINEDYVIKRIEELCEQKHWSKYRLAKKSGIPHSTIFNMLKRTNTPTIGTLVKICNGLGITLSQFFADDEYVTLTKQQKLLLRLWGTLENEEKRSFFEYYEDDGVTFRYLDGEYAVTGIALEDQGTQTVLELRTRGKSAVRKWSVVMACDHAPESIRCNGAALDFSFDEVRKELKMVLPGPGKTEVIFS